MSGWKTFEEILPEIGRLMIEEPEFGYERVERRWSEAKKALLEPANPLLIESWLEPDPDDRITTHDLYVASMEAMQRIEDLKAENEKLREALIAVSEDDEHGPGLCITKHTLDLVHATLEDK